MATKKRDKGSAEKELKAAVKKLRSQLAAAEKSAQKWKSRAKAHRAEAVGAKSELTAVRRRLDKATASATKWKARAKSADRTPTAPAAPVVRLAPDPDPVRDAVPEAVPDAAPGPLPGAAPDDSWTVTRLRAEARARGVAGYSRKTKVQLLADLRDGGT